MEVEAVVDAEAVAEARAGYSNNYNLKGDRRTDEIDKEGTGRGACMAGRH